MKHILSFKNFIFLDFLNVKVVTGSDVIGGTDGQGMEYTYIWHVFRGETSLRNRSHTKNNEKDVDSLLQTLFLFKSVPTMSLPVTSPNFTVKMSMKMKFSNDKIYYNCSQKKPKITNM